MMLTVDDPAALNAAAAAALEQAEVANPTVEVPDVIEELPETEIHLPGGFVTDDFDVVYEVEVRELNGSDEEAIAKTNAPGRALLKILERATVRVGEEKASKEILDRMLMGDRDAILLAIYRATYGKDVTFTAVCEECDWEGEVGVDLSTDVPVSTLSDAADQSFLVEAREGTISVMLPNGVVQRDLLTNPNASEPEMKTMLLSGCVMSVNGVPALKEKTARELGIKTRELLVNEIAKRSPGPKLNLIAKPCGNCGKELALPVTLANLFRLL